YGIGSRMKIKYTRAMLTAALNNQLDNIKYTPDPVFNLNVPESCPGVPPEILNPRNTWSDKNAYDIQAKKLANMFIENFSQFADDTDKAVAKAGPNKF